MTRVITITSASAGLGKTHLAINLSLELVRRGRLVGLFHVPDGNSPIDRFIDIQPLIERRHQKGPEQDAHHVITRGYLGIDIVSCTIPLSAWASTSDELLVKCAQEMDVEEGYDDFIIDTSCMVAREQVAACLASSLIVLLVTPEARSQAETFALLRILKLNGYAGGLRLLVNRVVKADDAQAIHADLNRETRQHLDLTFNSPWVIPEDDSVSRAERYRQAFSAVFPDAEATAAIVQIADTLGTLPEGDDAPLLSDWWDAFIEFLRTPIQLPGEAWLDDTGNEQEVSPAGGTVQALSENRS